VASFDRNRHVGLVCLLKLLGSISRSLDMQ